MNEEWLRSGIGSMFNASNKDVEILRDFQKLDPEYKDIVLDFVETLLTRQDEEE